jgi:excisionase family DNA binding protein
MNVSISEKYILSTEEAAEYFNIGITHLRRLIKQNENADWILWNGTHACIKRKLFEKFIDNANVI